MHVIDDTANDGRVINIQFGSDCVKTVNIDLKHSHAQEIFHTSWSNYIHGPLLTSVKCLGFMLLSGMIWTSDDDNNCDLM